MVHHLSSLEIAGTMSPEMALEITSSATAAISRSTPPDLPGGILFVEYSHKTGHILNQRAIGDGFVLTGFKEAEWEEKLI